MTTAGSHEITVDPEDRWTIRTQDGSLSAHYEHTVLITRKGPKVLTSHPVGEDLINLLKEK
jgi:methionyl aminopeptidase